MLVLRRRDGQWIELTHSATGQRIKFRVFDVGRDRPGAVSLAFDDPERHFEVQRPERAARLAREAALAGAEGSQP